MAHTAFAKREHFDAWCHMLGLTVQDSIDEPGTSARIFGSYRTDMSMDPASLDSLSGNLVRWLSNGEYTKAIVTNDPDGIRTVHYLNCNIRERVKYDYAESRELVG
jgi:hypothetical protein